jgi:hypothetical protein
VVKKLEKCNKNLSDYVKGARKKEKIILGQRLKGDSVNAIRTPDHTLVMRGRLRSFNEYSQCHDQEMHDPTDSR